MKDWNKKNGLEYKLLIENRIFQVYEVNGGTSYEVAHLTKIGKGNPHRDPGYYLPSNEQFGSFGNKSRVFYKKESAFKYFHELIKS